MTVKSTNTERPKTMASKPGVVASRTNLELYFAETRQLFNSMDPAPFRQRDLDSEAAAYIFDWAREAPAGQPLSMVVHVGNTLNAEENAAMLTEAVHEHFRRCAIATRLKLRQLFRVGRISLLIGFAFVGVAVATGEFISLRIPSERYAWLIQESLMIGAWVALWRPIEIFLYDWWPILAEARLHDRLGVMDIRVSGGEAAPG